MNTPKPFPRSGWTAFILVTAAFLRFSNLTQSPHWFSDEGTHLDIAQNLIAGNTQYLAVNQSILLFARLPLFEHLLAFALRLYPHGMTTLRGLTATLSLLTIGLLMLPHLGIRDIASDQTRTPPLTLIPALLLAILFDATLYARFGFSYNLLAPLLILIYWGLVRYRMAGDRRHLALACGATGLALISDLWAVPIAIVPAYVVLQRSWRDAVWALPLVALPGLIYCAHALLTVPDAWLFDLHYTLSRVSGTSLNQQLDTLADNLQMLVRHHSWLVLGGVGLLALPDDRRNIAAALFWIPLLVIGRATALFNLSFYYNIPLFPLACLGLVALYGLLHRTIAVQTSGSAQRGLLTALTLFSFVWIGRDGLTTLRAVQGQFTTGIDPFLVDPTAAQAAADFVNARLREDGLVLASPAVAWLIEGNSADFQHSAASVGLTTPHFPNNLPQSRFAFSPHHSAADYIITDPLWHNWAATHVPQVTDLLEQAQKKPPLFSQGGLKIYCISAQCREDD